MQVAEKARRGSVILAMLPDTGERYLSTPLFEPFGAGHERGRAGDHALDARATRWPERIRVWRPPRASALWGAPIESCAFGYAGRNTYEGLMTVLSKRIRSANALRKRRLRPIRILVARQSDGGAMDQQDPN